MGWILEKTPSGYIMYSTVVEEYISPLLKNERQVKSWINKNITRSKKRAFIMGKSDVSAGEVFREQLSDFIKQGDKEIPRKRFVKIITKLQLAEANKLKKVV